MAMDTNSTSFTSPVADATNVGGINSFQFEPVLDVLSRMSIWTFLFTLVALAVTYDQSTFSNEN